MYLKVSSKITLIAVLTVFAFSTLSYGVCSAEQGRGGVNPPPQGQQGPHPSNKNPGSSPPGHSKGEKRGFVEGQPPGWSKGHKEGWENMLPPGLQKSENKEEVKAFKRKLKDAEKKIKNARREGKLTKEELKQALLYMQLAARTGVPPEAASGLVARMVKEGEFIDSIEKATRAYAYGLDKQIDFDGLGRFVAQKIKEGYKGSDLAVAIYDEIDRRAVGLKVE